MKKQESFWQWSEQASFPGGAWLDESSEHHRHGENMYMVPADNEKSNEACPEREDSLLGIFSAWSISVLLPQMSQAFVTIEQCDLLHCDGRTNTRVSWDSCVNSKLQSPCLLMITPALLSKAGHD